MTADSVELRAEVATACRVLAHRGLVDGILGHVSARVSEDEIVIRCRTATESGLSQSRAEDVWKVSLDGSPLDLPPGADPPKELPIHTELMGARRDVGCVIHAHPPHALLSGLAGLRPRPVFGAYNIPAMRLAMDGVPIYRRPILITRAELAQELVAAGLNPGVALPDAAIAVVRRADGSGTSFIWTISFAGLSAVRLTTVPIIEPSPAAADVESNRVSNAAKVVPTAAASSDELVARDATKVRASAIVADAGDAPTTTSPPAAIAGAASNADLRDHSAIRTR